MAKCLDCGTRGVSAFDPSGVCEPCREARQHSRQREREHREREARIAAEWPDDDVSRLTTLPSMPGTEVETVIGLVSSVESNSGLTAATKGETALQRATKGLIRQARHTGANAVVGVVATAYGAGGGITNALGGDAVGVLLVGTAVRIRPREGN